MPRILVSPASFKHEDGPWREVLERAGFEFVRPDVDLTQVSSQRLIEELKGIEGVVASVEGYTPEVLAASKLRVIARVGVGYDSINVPAATKHGVAVVITPGTNHDSVAEQAISFITAIFRDLCCRDREMRRDIWRRSTVRRLAGNTLGLVGMGRIGKAIVPRAVGLGLKVLAYDPFPDAAFAAKHGVTFLPLEEVLGRADIVSLHLPCTSETTDFVNAKTIAQMKPGAVLINTARGGLVDEPALVEALKSGRLSAAGLDVFKVEPLPADSPFLTLDNVTLAPHMAGLDRDSLDAMSRLAAQCVVDLFHGRWPEGCVVNAELKNGWKW